MTIYENENFKATVENGKIHIVNLWDNGSTLVAQTKSANKLAAVSDVLTDGVTYGSTFYQLWDVLVSVKGLVFFFENKR